MTTCTLASLFDSHKDTLAAQLKGMKLPQDAVLIQNTVGNYLNRLFDEDGEFRQNLTQSEDYILKAALSLLKSQQDMNSALQIQPTVQQEEVPVVPEETTLQRNTDPVSTLIGAGGGALFGNVIGGGWYSVFGAIAGTAISIYISNNMANSHRLPTKAIEKKVLPEETGIDVFGFINITHGICESVDNLIATFRAQIRRVIDKYENQEKPSLEKNYSSLLEGVQSIIGFERAHYDEDKFPAKIRERIEDLAELLENYNLEVEDYSDSVSSDHFMFVPTPNTDKLKQVFPAILRDGMVVLKGKVFVPDNK